MELQKIAVILHFSTKYFINICSDGQTSEPNVIKSKLKRSKSRKSIKKKKNGDPELVQIKRANSFTGPRNAYYYNKIKKHHIKIGSTFRQKSTLSIDEIRKGQPYK